MIALLNVPMSIAKELSILAATGDGNIALKRVNRLPTGKGKGVTLTCKRNDHLFDFHPK